jgi:predicted enzyme related to lactoylglutathione lyase
MPAPIVFFDIAGPDVGALRAFYSRVFGWSVDGTGRFVVTVSSPLGAALREDPAQNVAATLLGVERNGGVVEAPRFEVPGVAVLGLFRDPAGNPMGLVELEAGRPKVP